MALKAHPIVIKPNPASVSSTKYSGYLNTPKSISADPIKKRINDAQAKIEFLFIPIIKYLLFQTIFLSNQSTCISQKNDR